MGQFRRPSIPQREHIHLPMEMRVRVDHGDLPPAGEFAFELVDEPNPGMGGSNDDKVIRHVNKRFSSGRLVVGKAYDVPDSS